MKVEVGSKIDLDIRTFLSTKGYCEPSSIDLVSKTNNRVFLAKSKESSLIIKIMDDQDIDLDLREQVGSYLSQSGVNHCSPLMVDRSRSIFDCDVEVSLPFEGQSLRDLAEQSSLSSHHLSRFVGFSLDLCEALIDFDVGAEFGLIKKSGARFKTMDDYLDAYIRKYVSRIQERFPLDVLNEIAMNWRRVWVDETHATFSFDNNLGNFFLGENDTFAINNLPIIGRGTISQGIGSFAANLPESFSRQMANRAHERLGVAPSQVIFYECLSLIGILAFKCSRNELREEFLASSSWGFGFNLVERLESRWNSLS